jgi:hypothetical protein
MNIQKVERFIELQERVNREIDLYGEASISSCDMLMEIGDSLSHEEVEKVVQLITK